MKKQLSITIDIGLYNLVKNKGNLSGYIEQLIADDMHKKARRAITEVVHDELLADGDFIQKVADNIIPRIISSGGAISYKGTAASNGGELLTYVPMPQ